MVDSNIKYQPLDGSGDHKNKNNFTSTTIDMGSLNPANLNPADHSLDRRTSSTRISLDNNQVLLKFLSALFYSLVSFWIMVINKIVLTNYKFPSPNFLGLGQMMATIVVLFLGKGFDVITFPPMTRDLPRKIFPLPIFYFGNMVFGLTGTQKLSLPMFTVLRRFGILMTLILEYLVLSVTQSKTIVLSVLGMIAGAIVAAIDDLAFDVSGYFYVNANNLCSAANGVYLKKKLEGRKLGQYGLLYYNSLFMLFPLLLICYYSGDIDKVSGFTAWSDPWFLFSFLSSCLMGFLLMFSTLLCTKYNSALTTTVIGCLKNILVTYVGMYVGGDYVFSLTNFIGVNLSMVASLVYSYVTFVKSSNKSVTKS